MAPQSLADWLNGELLRCEDFVLAWVRAGPDDAFRGRLVCVPARLLDSADRLFSPLGFGGMQRGSGCLTGLWGLVCFWLTLIFAQHEGDPDALGLLVGHHGFDLPWGGPGPWVGLHLAAGHGVQLLLPRVHLLLPGYPWWRGWR